MGNPVIWVIGGPTASGKTEVSIQLARRLGTEIISFDSRQLYQELSIGVARPSEDELNACAHHGIACHSIFQSLSAGEYARIYRPIVSQLLTKNQSVVLTGGTGLYLQHLLYDMDTLPAIETELREEINQLYLKQGLIGLVDMLLGLDPSAGKFIDIQNPARVKRTLELCKSTQKPIAEIHTGTKKSAFEWAEINFLGIQWERQALYNHINARVDSMVDAGLVNEVTQLRAYQNLTPLKTVGYTELFEYLNGEISREDSIEKIKQHSRNYAKRQITFFNRQFETRWLNKEDFNRINPLNLQH